MESTTGTIFPISREARRVLQGMQVRPVRLDLQDRKAFKDHKVSKDRRVLQVQRDRRVSRVHRVSKVYRVLRVQQDRRVLHLMLPVLPDTADLLVTRVLQVPRLR
jgi:hypothetical protein